MELGHGIKEVSDEARTRLTASVARSDVARDTSRVIVLASEQESYKEQTNR